ncbi:unnamed protein product [Effrenium voratum]|nr:unnamed protein product [Effrenium voratum]
MMAPLWQQIWQPASQSSADIQRCFGWLSKTSHLMDVIVGDGFLVASAPSRLSLEVNFKDLSAAFPGLELSKKNAPLCRESVEGVGSVGKVTARPLEEALVKYLALSEAEKLEDDVLLPKLKSFVLTMGWPDEDAERIVGSRKGNLLLGPAKPVRCEALCASFASAVQSGPLCEQSVCGVRFDADGMAAASDFRAALLSAQPVLLRPMARVNLPHWGLYQQMEQRPWFSPIDSSESLPVGSLPLDKLWDFPQLSSWELLRWDKLSGDVEAVQQVRQEKGLPLVLL